MEASTLTGNDRSVDRNGFLREDQEPETTGQVFANSAVRARARQNTTLPETETTVDVVFHGAWRTRGRTESSARPYRD